MSYNQELLAFFSEYLSEHKKALFWEVLSWRTRYITVVLEDIFQAQNASAVLRTCDCFGIQDVHIIENRHEYQVNPDVALGAQKWLSLYKYAGGEEPAMDALQHLKDSGYRIIATSPHANETIALEDLDMEKGKCAIVFGSELPGVSAKIMDTADECMCIPMHGFTESFNISVSAAVSLHYLSNKLHNSGLDWKLSDKEQETLHLDWARQSLKRPDLLEKRFKELNSSLK